jgi:hypothetical protein
VNDDDVVRAPYFTVVHEGPDGPRVRALRVTLAEALTELGDELSYVDARKPLENLRRLSTNGGVIVFHATELGKYRCPRGAVGLRYKPFRSRAILTWGCAPPLHESVSAVLWDFRAADAIGTDARPESPSAFRFSDAFVKELGALVPAFARVDIKGAIPGRVSSQVSFDRLLQLRTLSGFRVGRDLNIAIGALMRGARRDREATAVLTGERTLDGTLAVFDDMVPPARFARRDGVHALAFSVRGEAGGTPFQMEIADHPQAAAVVARIEAPSAAELRVVMADLGFRCGFQKPTFPSPQAPGEWLRAALVARDGVSAPETFELLVDKGLCAIEITERRGAMEAATLFASPASRAALTRMALTEADSKLRADLGLLSVLLADHDVPSPGEAKAAMRLLESGQVSRRREGLERTATLGPLGRQTAAKLEEALRSLARHDPDRDVRFVARALLVLR